MATRSVTTIRNTHGAAVALYRHHDGYPAEAGGALLEALRRATSAEMIIARLLSLMEDAPGGPRTIYELTGGADQHGDREHTYDVTATWDRKHGRVIYSIRHGRRRPHFEAWTYDVYTTLQFVEVVNRERAEINARMEASAHWRESARYPMISTEGL